MSRQCPLCRGEAAELDFHHWDYENDTGTEFCRPCHNAIHGGEDGRVSIQQNRAEYYGVGGWHYEAIINLIERDLEYQSLEGWDHPCEPINVPSGVWTDEEDEKYHRNRKAEWAKYKEYLSDRYSLPKAERINAPEVWGKYPVGEFETYLKTGEGPMESRGISEEQRRRWL